MLGSPAIDTEHLLLGLLREGRGVAGVILERSGLTHAALQRQLEERRNPGAPTSTSVDIPLTEDAQSVLLHAGAEAERMPAPHVGHEHLLLGLLAVPESFAGEILVAHGLRLDEVREEIRLRTPVKDRGSDPAGSFALLADLLRRLEERRAAYRVSPFSDDAVRVDIALPEEKWVVTFFADRRTTVEVFLPSGAIEDSAALARLFDRLGPPASG